MAALSSLESYLRGQQINAAQPDTPVPSSPSLDTPIPDRGLGTIAGDTLLAGAQGVGDVYDDLSALFTGHHQSSLHDWLENMKSVEIRRQIQQEAQRYAQEQASDKANHADWLTQLGHSIRHFAANPGQNIGEGAGYFLPGLAAGALTGGAAPAAAMAAEIGGTGVANMIHGHNERLGSDPNHAGGQQALGDFVSGLGYGALGPLGRYGSELTAGALAGAEGRAAVADAFNEAKLKAAGKVPEHPGEAPTAPNFHDLGEAPTAPLDPNIPDPSFPKTPFGDKQAFEDMKARQESYANDQAAYQQAKADFDEKSAANEKMASKFAADTNLYNDKLDTYAKDTAARNGRMDVYDKANKSAYYKNLLAEADKRHPFGNSMAQIGTRIGIDGVGGAAAGGAGAWIANDQDPDSVAAQSAAPGILFGLAHTAPVLAKYGLKGAWEGTKATGSGIGSLYGKAFRKPVDEGGASGSDDTSAKAEGTPVTPGTPQNDGGSGGAANQPGPTSQGQQEERFDPTQDADAGLKNHLMDNLNITRQGADTIGSGISDLANNPDAKKEQIANLRKSIFEGENGEGAKRSDASAEDIGKLIDMHLPTMADQVHADISGRDNAPSDIADTINRYGKNKQDILENHLKPAMPQTMDLLGNISPEVYSKLEPRQQRLVASIDGSHEAPDMAAAQKSLNEHYFSEETPTDQQQAEKDAYLYGHNAHMSLQREINTAPGLSDGTRKATVDGLNGSYFTDKAGHPQNAPGIGDLIRQYVRALSSGHMDAAKHLYDFAVRKANTPIQMLNMMDGKATGEPFEGSVTEPSYFRDSVLGDTDFSKQDHPTFERKTTIRPNRTYRNAMIEEGRVRNAVVQRMRELHEIKTGEKLPEVNPLNDLKIKDEALARYAERRYGTPLTDYTPGITDAGIEGGANNANHYGYSLNHIKHLLETGRFPIDSRAGTAEPGSPRDGRTGTIKAAKGINALHKTMVDALEKGKDIYYGDNKNLIDTAKAHGFSVDENKRLLLNPQKDNAGDVFRMDNITKKTPNKLREELSAAIKENEPAHLILRGDTKTDKYRQQAATALAHGYNRVGDHLYSREKAPDGDGSSKDTKSTDKSETPVEPTTDGSKKNPSKETPVGEKQEEKQEPEKTEKKPEKEESQNTRETSATGGDEPEDDEDKPADETSDESEDESEDESAGESAEGDEPTEETEPTKSDESGKEDEEEEKTPEKTPERSLHFLSGSIAGLKDGLPQKAIDLVKSLIEKGHNFLVGDARGVDSEFHKLLNTKNVVVYHTLKNPRNAPAGVRTMRIESPKGARGRAVHIPKDEAMAKTATSGVAVWNGHSEGTLRNIYNLSMADKPVAVIMPKSDGSGDWVLRSIRNKQEMIDFYKSFPPSVQRMADRFMDFDASPPFEGYTPNPADPKTGISGFVERTGIGNVMVRDNPVKTLKENFLNPKEAHVQVAAQLGHEAVKYIHEAIEYISGNVMDRVNAGIKAYEKKNKGTTSWMGSIRALYNDEGKIDPKIHDLALMAVMDTLFNVRYDPKYFEDHIGTNPSGEDGYGFMLNTNTAVNQSLRTLLRMMNAQPMDDVQRSHVNQPLGQLILGIMDALRVDDTLTKETSERTTFDEEGNQHTTSQAFFTHFFPKEDFEKRYGEMPVSWLSNMASINLRHDEVGHATTPIEVKRTAGMSKKLHTALTKENSKPFKVSQTMVKLLKAVGRNAWIKAFQPVVSGKLGPLYNNVRTAKDRVKGIGFDHIMQFENHTPDDSVYYSNHKATNGRIIASTGVTPQGNKTVRMGITPDHYHVTMDNGRLDTANPMWRAALAQGLGIKVERLPLSKTLSALEKKLAEPEIAALRDAIEDCLYNKGNPEQFIKSAQIAGLDEHGLYGLTELARLQNEGELQSHLLFEDDGITNGPAGGLSIFANIKDAEERKLLAKGGVYIGEEGKGEDDYAHNQQNLDKNKDLYNTALDSMEPPGHLFDEETPYGAAALKTLEAVGAAKRVDGTLQWDRNFMKQPIQMAVYTASGNAIGISVKDDVYKAALALADQGKLDMDTLRDLGIRADKKLGYQWLNDREVMKQTGGEYNPKTLEISTSSKNPLGKKLSASNLKLDGKSVESLYQASKVIDGDRNDAIENMNPADAKKATKGKMPTGFRDNDGIDYPLPKKKGDPGYYDYLWTKALIESGLQKDLMKYSGFTDRYATDSMFSRQDKAAARYVKLRKDGHSDRDILEHLEDRALGGDSGEHYYTESDEDEKRLPFENTGEALYEAVGSVYPKHVMDNVKSLGFAKWVQMLIARHYMLNKMKEIGPNKITFGQYAKLRSYWNKVSPVLPSSELGLHYDPTIPVRIGQNIKVSSLPMGDLVGTEWHPTTDVPRLWKGSNEAGKANKGVAAASIQSIADARTTAKAILDGDLDKVLQTFDGYFTNPNNAYHLAQRLNEHFSTNLTEVNPFTDLLQQYAKLSEDPEIAKIVNSPEFKDEFKRGSKDWKGEKKKLLFKSPKDMLDEMRRQQRVSEGRQEELRKIPVKVEQFSAGVNDLEGQEATSQYHHDSEVWKKNLTAKTIKSLQNSLTRGKSESANPIGHAISKLIDANHERIKGLNIHMASNGHEAAVILDGYGVSDKIRNHFMKDTVNGMYLPDANMGNGALIYKAGKSERATHQNLLHELTHAMITRNLNSIPVSDAGYIGLRNSMGAILSMDRKRLSGNIRLHTELSRIQDFFKRENVQKMPDTWKMNEFAARFIESPELMKAASSIKLGSVKNAAGNKGIFGLVSRLRNVLQSIGKVLFGEDFSFGPKGSGSVTETFFHSLARISRETFEPEEIGPSDTQGVMWKEAHDMDGADKLDEEIDSINRATDHMNNTISSVEALNDLKNEGWNFTPAQEYVFLANRLMTENKSPITNKFLRDYAPKASEIIDKEGASSLGSKDQTKNLLALLKSHPDHFNGMTAPGLMNRNKSLVKHAATYGNHETAWTHARLLSQVDKLGGIGRYADRKVTEVINAKIDPAIKHMADNLPNKVDTFLDREKLNQTARELFTSMAPVSDRNVPVLGALRSWKYALDRSRQNARTKLPMSLKNKFSSRFSKSEQKALFMAAKTDIAKFGDWKHNILNHVDEPLDPGLKPGAKKAADALAYHLATGKAVHNLLGNARTISRVHGGDTETIDRYVGRKAYSLLPQDVRENMKTLYEREKEAVSTVLDYHQDLQKRNMEFADGAAELNALKGYMPNELKDSSMHLAAVERGSEDYKRLKSLGYVEAQNLMRNGTETGKPLVLMSGRHSGNVTSNQGGFARIRYTVGGYNMENRSSAYFPLGTVEGNLPLSNKGGMLRPVFKANGRVSHYERMVDLPEKLAFSKHDDIFQSLGSYEGNLTEMAMRDHMNQSQIESLKKDYDLDKDKSGFINVADSKDPIIKQAYNALPKKVRAQLKETFGQEKFFPVRRSMVNDVIGYKKASVGDFWTGDTRWGPKVQKAVVTVAHALLGERAYQHLLNMENLVEEATGMAQRLISVASVRIPLRNMSNDILQLMSSGVPLSHILRRGTEIAKDLQAYNKSQQSIYNLRTALARRDLSDERRQSYERRISVEQERMDGLSVAPLIKAGMYSVVDDGLMPNHSSSGMVTPYIDAAMNRLPPGFDTVARNLFATQDSHLFRAVQQGVETSDFIARALTYEHNVETLGHDKAVQKAMDAFVDYGRARGRTRDKLESMGAMWFWNTKLRSLNIAATMMRDNPLLALLYSHVPFPIHFGFLSNLSTPVSDNILTQTLEGKITHSLGWGSLGSVWKMNPFVELMS